MLDFIPDYHNIEAAARNQYVPRVPLYDHIVSVGIMEKILNKSFSGLYGGNDRDLEEFFTYYNNFFKHMGYDVSIFEMCISGILPGAGALGGHIKGVIQNRADFERYPWNELLERYIKAYDRFFNAICNTLPQGMKVVGGVGNGLLECAEELVGYEDLCFLSYDDEELYTDLFKKIGDTMSTIWSWFLKKYGDFFAVCRFGDDLGFKSTTLISKNDIKKHIIPQYRRITNLVHSYNKPFLLHSCGNLFNVMDDIIKDSKIDAKHSNDVIIAPFNIWVEKYGDRLAFFGGVDTDHLCRKSKEEIYEIVKVVIDYNNICKCGVAIGSGNSVPDYVPVEGYLAMNEAVRKLRKE
ncbi:MAG: methylcobalamin:coenzyme methyltransferase [Clostridia bacterium]|nr:methylcobalamin:coenzyme methyltransferase [Clostridia bacterium]